MIFSTLADKAKSVAANNTDLGVYFAVTATVLTCLGAAEMTAGYLKGTQAPNAVACLDAAPVTTDAKPACLTP